MQCPEYREPPILVIGTFPKYWESHDSGSKEEEQTN
jgi:hypothetical protein